MADFIKLSITEEYKNKAEYTDFSKLDKAYPSPSCNVKDVQWYNSLASKVCALFYYETGILLAAYGGCDNGIQFYGYYSN